MCIFNLASLSNSNYFSCLKKVYYPELSHVYIKHLAMIPAVKRSQYAPRFRWYTERHTTMTQLGYKHLSDKTKIIQELSQFLTRQRTIRCVTGELPSLNTWFLRIGEMPEQYTVYQPPSIFVLITYNVIVSRVRVTTVTMPESRALT
jgi:hypothetical protein